MGYSGDVDGVDGMDGSTTKREVVMAEVCGMCGELKEEFCERCSTTPHFECEAIRKGRDGEDFDPVEVEFGKICSDCCWCHMLTSFTVRGAGA